LAAEPALELLLICSCRLPIDSAKKLRWYDKADVASLTRQHVREKHMLLDTITALKKVRQIQRFNCFCRNHAVAGCLA
jgi:hypothetical protein